jgi:hypothetical protein
VYTSVDEYHTPIVALNLAILDEISMPDYLMVVRSNPPQGGITESDFCDWYDRIHFPEVLTLPEFIAAERYELSDVVSGEGATQYLAHYRIRAESAEAAKRALVNAAQSGRFNKLGYLEHVGGHL